MRTRCYKPNRRVLDVSVTGGRKSRREGIRVHRRVSLPAEDCGEIDNIPLTALVRTFLDLSASRLSDAVIERAVNEADRLELIDPEMLRRSLADRAGQPGVARLRTLLDRRTFRLTDSELERLFLPITGEAGVPRPLTRQWVNGFRVDFYWPDLGLVVETDGLRYHRTAFQQAADRRRDQTHAAAGLTTLRFTHAQVKYEGACVRDTLIAVTRRLAA